MEKFGKLELSKDILDAIEKIGFKEMTKVQKEGIPLILNGESVVCQSQTGTGKTHTFLIPLLEKIDNEGLQAIIIAPTRELATQIFQELNNLNHFCLKKLMIKKLIGGTERQKTIKTLERKMPQIIVGTPGRVNDVLIKSNNFSFKNIKYLVIDEVDMIMDLGFTNELFAITNYMPKKTQFLLFSATISKRINIYIKKFIKQFKSVKIDQKETTNKNIKHFLINTKHKDPIVLLKSILETIKPYLAIVFVNKKEMISEVVKIINKTDLDTIALHSGLSPRERKNIINNIKKLKYHIVVASDLAARGMDFEGVSHIFSLDIPFDINYYIHRSGRSGRNNATGESYLFYNYENIKKIDELITKKEINFTNVVWKNDEFIVEKVWKRKTVTNFNQNIKSKIITLKNRLKREGTKPNHHKKYKKQISQIFKKEKKLELKTKKKKQRYNLSKQRQQKMKQINEK